MGTALKKPETTLTMYTQATPRVIRKVLLFDEENHKHLFPLHRDRDVGFGTQYEKNLIESVSMRLLSTMTTISRLRARRCVGE
jgi:hypothetical protein